MLVSYEANKHYIVVVSKAAYIPFLKKKNYICITSEEGSELILFSGKVPQTAGD